MTVKVLGPLDTGTKPLSPRERVILCALIVRQGSSMPPSELAEAYWGEALPQTWIQQVKTSVARIRSQLGRAAVLTVGSEYASGVEPDVIDAVRFERLVSSARQHALHGESERAIDNYRRALALWRGSAYPDLVDWEPGLVEAMRLGEIRRSAEEELLDARLKSGEHRAVIAEAERLVREEPLREDRWAILALANYQTDRQAEALAVVRAARERLLDELGIEPGTRLSSLETAMLRQDPSLMPATRSESVSAHCPYPGLSAFGEGDAENFFGREADVDAVLDRLTAGAVVAIAGPSGCGKSSLMLAGVLPRLQERGRTTAVIRPGTAAVAEVRQLVDAERALAVLAIDQTEELMRADAEAIEAFCEAVADFLDRGGSVALSIRSDFLDRGAALPSVGASIARGVYLLGPLSTAAMRDAITLPAQRAGLRLEPGLVEVLLRDAAGRSSTLPHLSHALLETWVRREGNTLTVDGYETAGGIAGAIALSAESLYQGLDAEGREICRSLMLRLVERGADGASVRRRAAASALLTLPQRRRVIEGLIFARLITVDGDAIMIAHEAVATAWPRLDGWLADDAEGARVLQSVESSAQAWDAGGRADDDLLRGPRLHAALDWQEQSSPDLTPAEADFLAASASRETTELTRIEEQARRERKQNRRLRWALAGAAGLVVVALVTGGLAALRGREAAEAADDRLVESITSTSIGLRSIDRDTAALMAVEAFRRWPDDARTRAALMATVTGAGGFTSLTHIPGATWRLGAWPIPGSDEIVIARDYTNVEVNDSRTGEKLRTLATDLEPPNQIIRPWVRVSADGSTAVVVQHFHGPEVNDLPTEYQLVHFFDLGSGTMIGDPVRAEGFSETVVIKDDGSEVVWASDGTLTVVGRDGTIRTTDAFDFTGEWENTRAAAAYGNDGSIHVANRDGDYFVVDPLTFEVRRRTRVEPGSAESAISITEDGTAFTVGRDAISAVDAKGEELWSYRYQRDWECSRIVASSESGVAVCGDELGTIQVRDLYTGKLIQPEADYLMDAGGDLVLTDGGRELMLMSALAPAIGRMRVDGGGPAASIVAEGHYSSNGFDRSGSRLLVGRVDERQIDDWAFQPHYAVWDIASNRAVFRIPEDIAGDVPGPIVEPRWIRDDAVLLWELSPPEREGEDPISTARVLDLDTGEFIDSGIPDDTYEAYPGFDGRTLYVTKTGGGLLAIDTASLEPTGFRVADFPEVAWRVVSSPGDDRVMATLFMEERAAWETRIYDGRTGELLVAGLPRTHATALISDDTLVASGNADLTLTDATTLKPVGKVPSNAGAAWYLAVSDDAGTLLGHGSGPRGMTLVDLTSGRQLGDPLPGSPDAHAWLAEDGSAFARDVPTGIQVWTLDVGEHARAACRLAGRELTQSEWDAYLGELGPRRETCAGLEGD